MGTAGYRHAQAAPGCRVVCVAVVVHARCGTHCVALRVYIGMLFCEVCASRCAKAPLGVAHRFAPSRVHKTGITLSGLRWVRSHSCRRFPVAFAPYAPPAGSLVAVVAPWHWSGASRRVSGQWPAASHVVCPARPCWASPLRGIGPALVCPSAPKGLPQPAPRDTPPDGDGLRHRSPAQTQYGSL